MCFCICMYEGKHHRSLVYETLMLGSLLESSFGYEIWILRYTGQDMLPFIFRYAWWPAYVEDIQLFFNGLLASRYKSWRQAEILGYGSAPRPQVLSKYLSCLFCGEWRPLKYLRFCQNWYGSSGIDQDEAEPNSYTPSSFHGDSPHIFQKVVTHNYFIWTPLLK